MARPAIVTALVVAAAFAAGVARAQSVDDVVEKNLAAMGGRQALSKLESRVVSGKVTVSVQATEIQGTIEIWLKAPNESRSLTRLDLSTLGGAELVVDQRCDGVAAFVSDSQRGNRSLSGSELAHMVNASFPTPLLDYKAAGARIELAGREKLAGRETLVLLYTPKSGAATRLFLDPETWLLVRAITTVSSGGADVQQVSNPSDYRTVDGVKVPFVVAVETPGQVLTMRLDKVANNVAIDESLFRRPQK
jgi:outer membrane lipoprotein-sorting protein